MVSKKYLVWLVIDANLGGTYCVLYHAQYIYLYKVAQQAGNMRTNCRMKRTRDGPPHILTGSVVL